MNAKKVRGALLVDFVKMIRSRKDVDWSEYLTMDDLKIINDVICGNDWYPFEMFERMVTAIMAEVALGDLKQTRLFGRKVVDLLYQRHPDLICKNNPSETITRFQTYAGSLLDFRPVAIKFIGEDLIEVRIDLGMNPAAEEIAVYQILGYAERLVELSGGKDIRSHITAKAWERSAETRIQIAWSDLVSEKKVKGDLFLDFVKMIKRRKEVDWSKHLNEFDRSFLDQAIIETDWYPFDTFERMGLAIMREIVKPDLEQIRRWGRYYLEELFNRHEALVERGNPKESIMRVLVLQGGFFNFEGFQAQSVLDNSVRIRIDFGMAPELERAICYQTLGFFEHLLYHSGIAEVGHEFKEKAWEGGRATVLELNWSPEKL